MADYVSPDARRRIATGLMAAQYAENPPAAPMGYDFNAAPLSPSLMAFAAQRGQPGVIQKTLGLIPGFDQDGKRGAQSWGNALMSTAQFPIDAVAGIGQALTAPARAYRGEFDPVSEEGVGEALNVAGNAMLGGIAAPKPAGVVGSAGGSLKGQAALDMSHAARMQRAREMGLDTDRMWYRGGKTARDELKAVGSEVQTPAIWFSSSPETASEFAMLRAKYGNYTDLKADYNPSVTPAYTGGNYKTFEGMFQAPNFERMSKQLEQAKADGYDGAIFKRLNDRPGATGMSLFNSSDVLAKFDGSNIRSPNAAFDPAKADSANLLYANGGRPGAATGAALGAIPDQAALMDRTYSRFGKSAGRAVADLDMSHAARMQRANDLGFDTGTTWYHGTSAGDFNEFAPGKRGATFFSDQPYVTDYFANPSRTDGPARVIPTYSRANKLFDPSKEADNPGLAAHIADNINQYDVKSIINPGKTHTKTAKEVLDELRSSSFGKDMFEPVEHPVIQSWIKNNGYDGFVVNDGSWMAMSADKPARIMGVFDPSKIRSVNAAFDPAKADSANLLFANGGRPGAATGAALGAIPDQAALMDRTYSRFGNPPPRDPFVNPESGQPFTGSGWHGSPDNELAAGAVFDRADPSMHMSPHGPWITNNRDVASTYTRVEPEAPFFSGSNVMPMEARFRNPMVYDAQGRAGGEAYIAPGNVAWDTNDISGVAKQRGHDGLVVRNVRDELQGGGALSDVFHPLQRGTVYSPTTGDLLYANGGKSGAATGAALGAPQSLIDPALADILRMYGLDVPSRPASPKYRPGDA